MKDFFKAYLFEKNILVNEAREQSADAESAASAVLMLASLFGIVITEGAVLADTDIIKYVSSLLMIKVPEPFYTGFPGSVKRLSVEEQVIDRVIAYARTYGAGDFSEPCHSLIEDVALKTPFHERAEGRRFVIVTEEKAEQMLRAEADNLMRSTRELPVNMLDFLTEYSTQYGYRSDICASKNTAAELLYRTRDMYYARCLMLSDVMRLCEIIYRAEVKSPITSSGVLTKGGRNIKLKNRSRRLVTEVLDEIFEAGRCDESTCCEKKAKWNGLLHHIHYKPKNERAQEFLNLIRGKVNISAYSEFERLMQSGDVRAASDGIIKRKGQGAFLRNLDYILSRCETAEDTEYVVKLIDARNTIILWQLYCRYKTSDTADGARTFSFVRFNLLTSHTESDTERMRRRSQLNEETRKILLTKIEDNLRREMKNRIGKVYVNPRMAKICLPIHEAASQGGMGTLPKGSRIAMAQGRVIRAFTYWERTNDIDLSAVAIDEKGETVYEFSWRSVWDNKNGIAFSGDQTSGYKGGSEYFDIDLDVFCSANPQARYLVFSNNVYSVGRFSDCLCTAGYMVREKISSGEVYEPKTVKSSFVVNCPSTMAWLFAIDLVTRELVWLNTALDSLIHVAGSRSMKNLLRYLHMADVMNYKMLFEMAATGITDNPMEADYVVSDDDEPHRDDAVVIRSCDTAAVLALMNGGEIKK